MTELETVRLHPAGWIVTRTTTKDTRLGSYHLPAGTTVVHSPYLLHHDRGAHDEPDTFDPDRWQAGQGMTTPHSDLFSFGAGARKCLGISFAQTELVLALAAIVSRWHLTPLTPRELLPSVGTALSPHDIRIRTNARDH